MLYSLTRAQEKNWTMGVISIVLETIRNGVGPRGNNRYMNLMGLVFNSLAFRGSSYNVRKSKKLSLYILIIYHFSTVVDFSSEKYSGSTGHRNSWSQQRNLQWGCQWWHSNSQPLGYKPSALAIELTSSKSYCWEGVEFIQLVHCIIIYLSFLNCGWLLMREVQWFYWTQELLVPAEKFTVRMPMVRLEL